MLSPMKRLLQLGLYNPLWVFPSKIFPRMLWLFLKDHIDTTEYYGKPERSNGVKRGGIELLQSGKVSADYSVKGQQVTVEASPKIEEELHTEQEKNISVPVSLQVPVWEAYEKEKGNPGENTYQNTVDDYTKNL